MEPLDLEGLVTSEMTVVVCGDQRSGKSSVVTSLCHGVYSDTYKATVGVDYDNRILEVDGTYVKLHLWDTSGQEGFLWVAKRHIKSADAFVLMYDVTDKDSFQNLSRWISLINRVATARNIPKLVVGNKLDLRHKQVVSCSRAKEFAIPEGCLHIEVSCLMDKNIGAAFYILAQDVLRYRKLGCVRRMGEPSPVISFPDMEVHEDPSGAMEDSGEYTHQFKVMLLGDERVGKTSLRYRFCKGYYSAEYTPTAGFDYSCRVAHIDGDRVKLQIWDVSGDRIYEQMRKGYYRGANAYIIVYDVTSAASFASAERLLKELCLYGQGDAPKVVVGNKSDKGHAHRRAVPHDQARDWADGWRLPLLETSCKHNDNVDAGFLKLAVALKRQMSPWKHVYDL